MGGEQPLSCPECKKALSQLSQEELWRKAQAEIIGAFLKFYPETTGVELSRCEKGHEWIRKVGP